MKFVNETRTRTVARTIDGITHHVPQKYSESVPRMPRDWDAIATRTAAGIVLALTAVAVTWSTVSIGGLLGGGVGYAAAVVFDASWLTVLLLEWLARFDPAKRSFPRHAGWLLVLIAAGAIAWNGALEGSTALAVVGALVSVISKLLWLAVFKHIDRPIGEEDAAWLAAEESRLSAQEAIAGVRLRAAMAEERTALRLLQAERIRGGAAAALALGTDVDQDSPQVSHVLEESRPTAVPVGAAPQVASGVPEVSQAPRADETVAEKEADVRELTKRLRAGEALSVTQAADLLGVPRSTAGRRLAEARARVDKDGSPYL